MKYIWYAGIGLLISVSGVSVSNNIALAAPVVGDSQAALIQPNALARPMPARLFGQFGTNVDNRTNTKRIAGGDGDMGGLFPPCIFNNSVTHPIEFDITVPGTPFMRARLDPTQPGGTLRMDVFDVDTNTVPGNPEIDQVRVNGKVVGNLSGANNIWGVNQFPLPANTLKWGINRVQVLVDRGNKFANWCTAIGWGIATIPRNPTGALCFVDIVRGWISPRDPKRGDTINFFAEVAGKPASVQVFYKTLAGAPFVTLTDPDGDNIYTGQKMIPFAWTKGWKRWFLWKSVKTTKLGRKCTSFFPAIKVK